MPQQNNIYTVKELNERIQELVSGEPWLGSLGVEGEITGLGTDKRGHMYFSLKDPSGVLAAVMFAGKHRFLRTKLGSRRRLLIRRRLPFTVCPVWPSTLKLLRTSYLPRLRNSKTRVALCSSEVFADEVSYLCR